MDYDLPEFDHAHAKRQGLVFSKSVFGEKFKKLTIEDDGRCRITFDKSYFVLQGDNTEPSKSQWSTLKKKMKRHNRGVFVFKETGETPCLPESQTTCYYVDFGFFKY
ncbi:MAG: hypothetical protein AAFV93_17655 [Chloroflexota bacterium]